jgi:hypothetical protein
MRDAGSAQITVDYVVNFIKIGCVLDFHFGGETHFDLYAVLL